MFDVAVIGLGPVGCAAAGLLAAEGLQVLAVDRDAAVFDKPRAITIDRESLRLLQALGLGPALEAALGDWRPTEFRAADGALLRRLIAAPEGDTGAWAFNRNFLQPELDAALRERLRAWPNVTLRLGDAVLGCAQHADHAQLEFAAGEPATARWVIASDGANSRLRRQCGTLLEDLDFDEPWVVVDTLLDDPSVPLPETNVQYCNPARPTTFIHGPRNLRRWEFMILPGEVPAEMATEESVWRLLAPWMKPGQTRLWRIAAYRFHALVAQPWRFGRVFLAGDAAHQTPPFMGQGLNQGLRDAGNLAWKLAAVARGEAGDALLDSYEAERRPNVRDVIAVTRDLGRIVCERDPAKVAARDAALRAEVAAGRGDLVRQDLLPALRGGCLSETPGAGAPCPQPWVIVDGARRRLDEVAPAGWRLLVLGDAAVPETRVPVVRLEAGALEEADGLLAGWLAARGAVAVLERPDHVVFGTAAVGEIEPLIEQRAALLVASNAM
jgi:3-(3-hydroxy-phenyl)propionate hydroxylase